MTSRILIQCRKSELYLLAYNEWTSARKEAKDFRQVIEAANFVHANRINNVDVVMHFDDPKYDVRISPDRKPTCGVVF